ncbi:MAG: nuclear transport factor 2 family protein [Ferruginibacter sp.]
MHNSIENISDFFACYKKAAWERDIMAMISLYDENVMIFDMWNKGFAPGIHGCTSMITDWLSSLKGENVNVEFEMIEIQENENIAFASALIQFEAIDKNNSVIRSMKNRISLGFVKTGGYWKVKHQHTSAPIDSNLKAILDI